MYIYDNDPTKTPFIRKIKMFVIIWKYFKIVVLLKFLTQGNVLFGFRVVPNIPRNNMLQNILFTQGYSTKERVSSGKELWNDAKRKYDTTQILQIP